MYLITSAAYVVSELATEYGKIPPSFLPLQNRKLYTHQLALLKKTEDKILSLPSSFKISSQDEEILNENKVKIVYVPDGISLGRSVVYVLNVIAKYAEPIRILHGDTLFDKITDDLDVYILAKAFDNYLWDISPATQKEGYVYAGYFSFSNQSLLIQSITQADYNFIDGILLYQKRIPVTERISETWHDFGHLNTFYRSKTKLTTQRFFNALKIDGFSVIKKSADTNKILAEANWYSNMPITLKKYVPSLWDVGEDCNVGYYQIEYFYLSTLAELFVFGKNEFFIWHNILNACNDFFNDCIKFRPPKELNIADNAMKLYKEKALKRLTCYSNENNIDLDCEWVFNGIKTPSLNQILEEVNSQIMPPSFSYQSIIHGDFCFSNILYDFRTKSIKVIDPRGVDAIGNHTIFGDIRYDIAKLAHSVLGMYDIIIAGYFSYNERDKYDVELNIYSNTTIEKIQKLFVKSNFAGLNIKQASTYPIIIDLFLSMIPLHNDQPMKQKAMLANALRLYLDFKNIYK